MRPKYIQTPDELWKLFENYKTDTFKDKLTVPQSHVKLGVVYLDYYPPLTEQGFEAWLCNKGIISQTKDYFTNRDNRYDEFVPIVTRIKNEIFSHNFKYAAVGAYKENLIARQLGMADKQEANVNVTNFNAKFGNSLQSTPQSSQDTQ